MPTENRSSNTVMISVPRELADRIQRRLDLAASAFKAAKHERDQFRAILDQPTDQHQGEPVALPACKSKLSMSHDWDQGYAAGWSACLDEIAKLGPLYTHADPAEVERLREVIGQQKSLIESLRAELLESHSIDDGAKPSSQGVHIPEGYCVMPRRLTAENGAKALLLGEFQLNIARECPECRDLEQPVESCDVCDGAGEFAQSHTIPWDQIKFIYSMAVKGLALKSQTAGGASQMTFEYVHEDGERRTVSVSRAEVAEHMDSELFEKLTETICHCEPIGETNVVDCRCDEVAEQFELVKPS
ncbi:hypothetical protein [Pseudomonas rustica]